MADYETTRSINIEGLKALVDAICGDPVLVFASTCSVYGNNDGAPLKENGLVSPTDYYSDTKIVSETYLQRAWPADRLRILRFGTLFGNSATMREDLVVNAMCRSYANSGKVRVDGGHRWRPFVDCADAARYAVESVGWSILQDPSGIYLNTVNICPEHGDRTLREVALELRAIFEDAGIDENPTAGDNRDYRVDTELLRRYSRLTDTRSLSDGIRKMVAMMQSEQKKNHLASAS